MLSRIKEIQQINAVHYNSNSHKLSDFKTMTIERVVINDNAGRQ